MKKKLTIEYNWSRDDGKKIKDSHMDALEESAQNRIKDMWAEGYTSGELSDNIIMDDEDGDGIEYSGWWSLTTETL